MYGFKKMKKRVYGSAFAHPNFRRDGEESQGLIKRRKGVYKNSLASRYTD